MGGMGEAKMTLDRQYAAIMTIPERVVKNWPAFFSFAVIDYALAIFLNAVPPVSGMAGQVVNAGLRGMRDVTKQVTWEAVKTA